MAENDQTKQILNFDAQYYNITIKKHFGKFQFFLSPCEFQFTTNSYLNQY